MTVKKFLSLALCAVLCCSLLSACASSSAGGELSSGSLSETDLSAPQPTPSAIPSPTPRFADGYTENVLTGLSVEEAYSERRPVCVMINNIHLAQPLVGITDADILYECLVEGGITRIMAVYQDPHALPSIGSVRSARVYFINIARGLGAVYFHAGAAYNARVLLNTGVIDSFDLGYYPEIMWRDQERRENLGYEHSCMTSGERIETALSEYGIDMAQTEDHSWKQLFSDESPVLSGESATHLLAQFSSYKNTIFDYDAEKETYLVSQFDSPQMDSNTNAQNSKQNVIVIRSDFRVLDNSGRLEIFLVGSGSGYYMSHGKYIPITWEKESEDSPMIYSDASGAELSMLPGQIYVCVVPLDAMVDFS